MKKVTIFYSWQSHTSQAENHYFIRDALKGALKKVNQDVEAEEAERVELDHDTKNIPGMPDVFNTILEKIDSCIAFVADLTLTGSSFDGEKKYLNPNVAIEFGYALKSKGNKRLIGIMNTAFGTFAESSFDLKTKRKPIEYCLKGDETKEERKRIRGELESNLVEALKILLKEFPLPQDTTPSEIQSYPECPALFQSPTEPLATTFTYNDGGTELRIVVGPLLFLRLLPASPQAPISALEAANFLKRGNVDSMSRGNANSRLVERNRHGAIVFSTTPSHGEIVQFSQLFFNREVWGCDGDLLNRERLLKRTNGEVLYLPFGAIEDVYETTLESYLSFATKTLQVHPPFKLVVGAWSIQGFRMHLDGDFTSFGGHMVDNEILWEGKISENHTSVKEVLTPFYRTFWEKCGLEYHVKGK